MAARPRQHHLCVQKHQGGLVCAFGGALSACEYSVWLVRLCVSLSERVLTRRFS